MQKFILSSPGLFIGSLISLLSTSVFAQQDISATREALANQGVLAAVKEAVISIGSDLIEHIPFMVAALIILSITWILNKVLRRIVGKLVDQTNIRGSLQDLLLRFISIVVWFGGLMVAAIILFPGLSPASALGALGLASVAVGFAFKDIFENFFAGILILWRFPFEKGDIIEIEGITGRVEDLTIRMTELRQMSGELILIPNAILFKNPVKVLTNKPTRRVSVMTGVGYDEDAGAAIELIRKTLQGCSSINHEQPIEVFANAFGSSSIDIEMRFWAESKPGKMKASASEVITAVKQALDDAGIEIPYPYRTLTFNEPLQMDQPAGEQHTSNKDKASAQN